MKRYVGLDVSLDETSICAVDDDGRVVERGCVASDPEAIVTFIAQHAPQVARIVLESGQLSTWLTRELRARGLPVACIDARQAHRVLSGRLNKSDRNDAEGLAQLARTGWFKEVHIKGAGSDGRRALLGARERMVRVRKDLEGQMRGLLKTYGIKLGHITLGRQRSGFRHRIKELMAEHRDLAPVLSPLLAVHATACCEEARLDTRLRRILKTHKVSRHLMTIPGIGAVTAATFVAVIDDPERFSSSAQAGAYIGLTPRRYQSGQLDYSGRISKCGDAALRACLYEAATALLTKVKRLSPLKSWAVRLAARKGHKKAAVATARKLAVLMLRIWKSGTNFQWTRQAIKEASMSPA